MNYTLPRFVDTTVLLARIYEASIWQVMPVDFWDTPQMRTKALLLNSILMLGITFSNLYDSLFVPFIFTIEFMLPFFDIDILHPDRTLPTFFVNNMCNHHFYNTNVMRSEFYEEKNNHECSENTHTLEFIRCTPSGFPAILLAAFSTLHRRVSYLLNSRKYAHWQSNVLAKLLYPSWRTNACLPLRHAVCSHFVVQVPGVFWQKGNWANRFSDIPDNPSDFHPIYSWWYFRHTIELSCE